MRKGRGGGGCRGASNCRMGLHGSDTIEICLPQYSLELLKIASYFCLSSVFNVEKEKRKIAKNSKIHYI